MTYLHLTAEYAPAKIRERDFPRWEITVRYTDSQERPQDPGEVVVPDFEDIEELEKFIDEMPEEVTECDVIEVMSENVLITQGGHHVVFLTPDEGDEENPAPFHIALPMPLNGPIYAFATQPPVKVAGIDDKI